MTMPSVSQILQSIPTIKKLHARASPSEPPCPVPRGFQLEKPNGNGGMVCTPDYWQGEGEGEGGDVAVREGAQIAAWIHGYTLVTKVPEMLAAAKAVNMTP